MVQEQLVLDHKSRPKSQKAYRGPYIVIKWCMSIKVHHVRPTVGLMLHT